MVGWTISKNALKNLFDELRTKYRVVGPVRKGGATYTYSFPTFDIVENWEDMELNYEFSMLPLKKLFFPDSQPIYSWEKRGETIEIRDQMEVWETPIVFFGVKPCDIAALNLLDKVLSEGRFVDYYYQKKRENSVLIGLTCNKPLKQCFCNIMGTGPDIESGYDLLLTDIGEKYYVKIGSKVGEEIISTYSNYFQKATSSDEEVRREILNKVKDELMRQNSGLELEKILENLENKFDDDIWTAVARRCLTCGACTMVCPTCHCFSVIDRSNLEVLAGVRVLVWDSCHYEAFSEMAGGFNVRAEKKSRCRHRIYHKTIYSLRRYGVPTCVGCGRCYIACPAHIDLREIFRGLLLGVEEVEI